MLRPNFFEIKLIMRKSTIALEDCNQDFKINQAENVHVKVCYSTTYSE